LKASGCIAVSGGLEVASDRLLERMKKGVTVAQVARVADAFTQAGIMVHAYLMYGFPTQTMQETIDSLEMVRQLFQNGVVQSGFWHRFAMTAHSPVGVNPAAFDVQRLGPDLPPNLFADNDLDHADPLGANHDLFAEGLRKSLFNYMHGVCFEFPHQKWFDFKVPPTTIPPRYIEKAIRQRTDEQQRPNALVVWPGGLPTMDVFETEIAGQGRGSRKKTVEMAELEFYGQKDHWMLNTELAIGEWLMDVLPRLSLEAPEPMAVQQLKLAYEQANLGDFEEFKSSPVWKQLRENGLLVV
jgi:hypothetical protein